MTYRIAIAIMAILGVAPQVNAQGEQFDEKKINKTYLANKGSYVELNNRYGDIEVVPWEKDSVKIQVTIRTYSDKYEWRQIMMESIHVDFTRTSGFIIAETSWKEDASLWRKSTYNVSKELGSNRIEVGFKVFLPTTMPLEVNNKFGNVFMTNHQGELDVKVHHGDFRARDLTYVKSLEVKYGKVKVRKILKGQVDLGSGSSLDLDETEELLLSSSSSEIEIDEAGVLNVTSKHDDIFIENVEKLYGSFSLSDLKISALSKDLKADFKFGSLRIMQIDEGVERVSIESNKTTVVLGLSPEFAGRFDIDVDEADEISVPKQMYVSSQGENDEKRWNIQGSMGSHSGTMVSISSVNGYVKIGE